MGSNGRWNLRDGVTLKEGRAATESIAFGSVLLGVAKFAVDVVIGSIASQHRVQDTVALFAVEARLVPDLQNFIIVILAVVAHRWR